MTTFILAFAFVAQAAPLPPLVSAVQAQAPGRSDPDRPNPDRPVDRPVQPARPEPPPSPPEQPSGQVPAASAQAPVYASPQAAGGAEMPPIAIPINPVIRWLAYPGTAPCAPPVTYARRGIFRHGFGQGWRRANRCYR